MAYGVGTSYRVPRINPAIVVAVVACVSFGMKMLAEEPLPDVKRMETSALLARLQPNPVPSPPQPAAEETLSKMSLPEGFRAVVVAAEPTVRQPVAMAFDERGRIWVAEAYRYPTKRPDGEGLDRLVILEDSDGDGQFETRKVFVE